MMHVLKLFRLEVLGGAVLFWGLAETTVVEYML